MAQQTQSVPGHEFDPSTLRPFTTGESYLDQYETGLYPGSRNDMPLAYLTCDGFRHYSGFGPHVWRDAFGIKWLIESQIRQEPGTAYEGTGRRLPWLAWGAYVWDNTWDPTHFTDGVHPAPKALAIFVEKCWQHLSSDSVAQRWLFRPSPAGV